MPFPVDNIRKACEAKGITIAELERELGIGNGVIRRWEFAKTAPPFDRIVAIADYLEVSVSDLTMDTVKRPNVSVVEKVRVLCKQKKVPVSKLESDLGFGNGYLNPKKAQNIPYLRLLAIAEYLGVSIYEITGGELKYPHIEGTLTFKDTKKTKKKNPAPANGDEEKRRQDYITRFDRAPVWLQDQVLALLEAAESHRAAQDEDPTE